MVNVPPIIRRVSSFAGGVRRSVRIVIGTILIVTGAGLAFLLGVCRIYVPPGMCLVRIAKFGRPLPADQTVAAPGEKGIQRETWGPGRYFLNPLAWDTELVKLVEIKPGRPETWSWVHTTHRLPSTPGPDGNVLSGEFPQVGILTRKTGPAPPSDEPVSITSQYRGIIQEVLTPGTYRINPYEYSCEIRSAVVIPPGFVGVVTNQIGVQPDMIEVPDLLAGDGLSPRGSGGRSPAAAAAGGPPTATSAAPIRLKKVRPLAEGRQRGTLRHVLPPGLYFTNPYLVLVKITEVGFNEFSQLAGQGQQRSSETIRFPSKSGYDIELGVTVVWGLHPRHAAEVINEFGTTNEVLEKVIRPQLRSICRNQGSFYEASDFIQGEKREEFQRVLTDALHTVCAQKNIELLLALISTIDVHSQRDGDHAGETDLRTAIQESFIAVERQATNVKKQETATVKAALEQAKKKVDVSRETIQAQTRLKVATTTADGERKAAEIQARGRLTVAEIEQQMATIEAEKTELLGKAQAEVERLKKQAEADGKKLLVEALGSGEAYNLYTFAEGFEPESVRMIFAGDGTLWTDLQRFEDIAATRIVKEKKRPHDAADHQSP